MNTKKAAIIISGVIVAAGAGGFLYWDNAYNFTSGAKGRKINSDGYYADFEKFNGTDSSEKTTICVQRTERSRNTAILS